MGRESEARYILGRLRGDREGEERERAEAEFQEIVASCEMERSNFSKQSYFHMFFGIGSGKMHTARRVQLCVWFQIMQEWIGIAGVTVYAPTIFGIAGMSPEKRQWISGLNNVFYMFATLICVFTLDRIGRRWTCYWGSVGQGIAMALGGAFSYLGQQARDNGESSKASGYGIAAVSMVFLFTSVFGATWLTVPWLYPAEVSPLIYMVHQRLAHIPQIFPLEVRAKGNAWGVVGWSIGNGWLTLLCPVMFKQLGEKTLYIFAACNAITIPMIWALYPETNQRTLEEIDLLFASDSIWNWEAEKNFARLKQEGALDEAVHVGVRKRSSGSKESSKESDSDV